MIHDCTTIIQLGKCEFVHWGNPKSASNVKFHFLPYFESPSATEIRCQEKSKGGLRYEVILAEPNVAQVQIPKVIQQSATPKPLSAQEIADKLKAAEDRRLVRGLMKETKVKGMTAFEE